MYYIINQSDQIVAIDPQLLSQLEIESADMFYQKVALHDIAFELNGNEVTIVVDGMPRQYTATVSPLAGMLGNIRLVDIDAPDDKKDLQDNIVKEESATEKEHISSFDELDLFETKEKDTYAEQEAPKEEETISTFDNLDLLEIKDETPPSEEDSGTKPDTEEETVSLENIDLFEPKEELLPIEKAEIETETKEEEDLFELILPTEAENAIEEIKTAETEEKSVPKTQLSGDQNTPIYIDVERVSEKIGISTDDYNLFLNEYIDTALTFEKALQSQDENEKEEALKTLTHLSNVLHLPFVKDILTQIKSASLSERDSAIESFFSTLGRLTTAHFEEEKLPLSEEEPVQEVSEEKREPIDLSDIKPIHFDFQLEEAAKDLSLPVELIEEFVNDFIVQAHEETEKMLKAYEKGDLETVQKIGHLLKGTSSNLRINPLSDTLYEIQFNEEIDRVPELVRNYWAHFLSLENQIKLISKK